MIGIEEARAWYADDDPVHGFDHVLRVLRMAERIGAKLDANLQILRAAALLHDAAGAHPEGEQVRREHEMASADFARHILSQKQWSAKDIEAVVHCIQTHRYRNQQSPESLEAKILFDADKLDVVGAFGVARTIGYAVQAGQPIHTVPSRQFLETGEKVPGEAHSAYHEYLFKLRNVKQRLFTEAAQQIAEHRHQLLCAFFDQLNAEAGCED